MSFRSEPLRLDPLHIHPEGSEGVCWSSSSQSPRRRPGRAGGPLNELQQWTPLTERLRCPWLPCHIDRARPRGSGTRLSAHREPRTVGSLASGNRRLSWACLEQGASMTPLPSGAITTADRHSTQSSDSVVTSVESSSKPATNSKARFRLLCAVAIRLPRHYRD